MPRTEAQRRAKRKWEKTQRQMNIMVSPIAYEKYKNYADAAELSLRAFMLASMDEYISAHPISPAEDEPT